MRSTVCISTSPWTGSQGYHWATSKREADQVLRAFYDKHKVEPADRVRQAPNSIAAINITPTKRDIVSALNEFAGYPDNG